MGCDSSKDNQVAAPRRQDEYLAKDAAESRRDANWDTSALCNPQLRDPLTLAISFMPNPGRFRRVCTFTVECWDHARYLEVPLACSVASVDSATTRRAFPSTLSRVGMASRSDRAVTLGWMNRKPSTVKGTDSKKALQVTGLELQDIHFRSVGDGWLCGCQSLKSVSFINLPELTTVGVDWLCMCCTSLISVTFEKLPKLQSVGGNWFCNCVCLKSLSFVDLPELTEVGFWWLCGCASMETVTFERLSKLRSVGEKWLGGCAALRAVRIVDLPELTRVGSGWLDGCTILETVTCGRVPKALVTRMKESVRAECELWFIEQKEDE